MSEKRITKIELLNCDEPEKREIVYTLSNGSEVHAIGCDGWTQWGG